MQGRPRVVYYPRFLHVKFANSVRSAIHRMPLPTRRFALALIALAGLVGGCSPEKPQPVHSSAAPLAGPAEVKLLVVDDPPIAAEIEQLRAEWKARTGTAVVVTQATSDEIEAASTPPAADAVVYPSRLLGTLAERAWIAPLPADFAAHRELAWSDTFELSQVAETNWNKTPHAIPFGSPLLTCYYRSDLLEHLHKSPPQNWQEFHELASMLRQREQLADKAPAADVPWYGVVQPLAESCACRVLLARAASYAKHPDHFSTLFDVETMEPLIAGAAFVRALEELVADAKLGPPNQLELDFAAARGEFLAGHAALALTWPGHAGEKREDAPASLPPTGFAELPGAPVVYNFVGKSWEKRHGGDDGHVPTLALAGRLGSVAAKGAQPAAAFQLLGWLAGREWGARVSSKSPATTLYRRSQVRSPQVWLDPNTDAAAAQAYAALVQATLSRQQYLSALRIPGEAEYMAALDVATRDAVRGDKSPADALSAAAEKWRDVTKKFGLDAQKSAYRRSLGL
jgi:multiple sugar transport system substrate-binding protein